jgi:hypothetical protein
MLIEGTRSRAHWMRCLERFRRCELYCLVSEKIVNSVFSLYEVCTPSFINDLYYFTKDNITTTTQPLAKSNIVEQPQTPILMTTALSLNNDEVIGWTTPPTIHNLCYEAHNIGNIPCPQGDEDQDLIRGCNHREEVS